MRWTEQHNFEAILDMLASGALNMEPLISHRFPIDQAEAAYQLLGSGQPSLGILLEYPRPAEQPNEVLTRRSIDLAPLTPTLSP